MHARSKQHPTALGCARINKLYREHPSRHDWNVPGVAASLALTRTLSGLLFGVSANDPLTFLGMLVLLTAVAGMAGYQPARRASMIDPMAACECADRAGLDRRLFLVLPEQDMQYLRP